LFNVTHYSLSGMSDITLTHKMRAIIIIIIIIIIIMLKATKTLKQK